MRSHQGREVLFEFPFVEVAGAQLGGRFPGIDPLSEGDSVGFDVGWTSAGLRVTAINRIVALIGPAITSLFSAPEHTLSIPR